MKKETMDQLKQKAKDYIAFHGKTYDSLAKELKEGSEQELSKRLKDMTYDDMVYGGEALYSLLTPSADVQERAKEYSKEHSFAQFMKDNGHYPNKMMKTDAVVVLVGKYLDLAGLAGASSGMQWVKASERLPDKSHNYHVRVWSEKHQYFYNDTNHYDKGWSDIRDTKDSVTYWLDESSPSSMQKENERLREALEKIQAGSLTGELTRPNMNKIAREALNKQQ